MPKISVGNNELNNLISSLYTARTSGATIYHANLYPELFSTNNINPRSSWSNVLLGTTITNFTTNKYVVGISYNDLSENKDNEDLFEIDSKNSTIETGYRGKIDKSNPLYAGTHKNSKKYLHSPLKNVEIFLKRIRYHLF
jgi:hypothetical protein